MDTTIEKKQNDTKEKFLRNFKGNGLLEESHKMEAVRAAALEALQGDLDFPNTKVERWKYTRVKKILNGSYSQAPCSSDIDITPYKIKNLNALTLVFVDGFFREDLSDSIKEGGVQVIALSRLQEKNQKVVDEHYGAYADHQKEPFTALNAAYVTDGAFIHVEAKEKSEQPIHILHLLSNSGVTAQQRNLIVAEPESRLDVVQTYRSLEGEKSFNNVVNEFVVKEKAFVNFDKIQYEGEGHYHIATDQVHQAADSHFDINTFTLNGGLVRNDLNIEVDAENCETHLNGLYVTGGKQHVDNHTLVHHLKPNCNSNELYKGIMDDKSTAVFNGKVFVHKHAQKIDAYQTNNNILLSDDGTVYTKPELEIYADDVSCSHGSTTGEIDEKALNYLRSRGIDKKTALKLLVHAFASEVLEKVESVPVRDHIHSFLTERYSWEF